MDIGLAPTDSYLRSAARAVNLVVRDVALVTLLPWRLPHAAAQNAWLPRATGLEPFVTCARPGLRQPAGRMRTPSGKILRGDASTFFDGHPGKAGGREPSQLILGLELEVYKKTRGDGRKHFLESKS